jgi:hypothetical protein
MPFGGDSIAVNQGWIGDEGSSGAAGLDARRHAVLGDFNRERPNLATT